MIRKLNERVSKRVGQGCLTVKYNLNNKVLFKNLVIRAISGAVFVALIISSILVPTPFYFGGLFLAIVLLGLREFYSLAGKMPQVNVSWTLPMLSGAVLFSAVFGNAFLYTPKAVDYLVYALYALLISAVFVMELFRKQENPIKNIAVSLMGQFYIVIPICAMLFLKAEEPMYLLAFFVTIWASDTGAYLTGMCFGKHKMFERVSPKKTWEGLFGGFVFALISGYVFSLVTAETVARPLWCWIFFAVVVFAAGTLGDLIESLFKRTLNVKDSGNIMPGHGGVLDRFDSALLAAPLATAVAFLVFKALIFI